MALRYRLFDPTSCGFPAPRVSILPKLASSMWGRASDAWPSGFSGRDAYFYSRGRYALCEAYRLAGVGAGGSLLAPAYHCRTMLDPAISLGAPVLLYPLNESLQPDIAALERLILERGPGGAAPVRALLLTHYFGMPQELSGVGELCARHGIVLIEDCSHAYFGKVMGATIGTLGDYAVASPYKFFACEDGGVLVANHAASLPAQRPRRPTLATELRGMARAVHAARNSASQRVAASDIVQLDGTIAALTSQPLRYASEAEMEQECWSGLYDPGEEGAGGLAGSRWLVRNSDTARLAERRRANYQAWVDAVRDLPNCRALFPNLPDACVPYMFPLYIEHPNPHFYLLKQLGVPVWRWDEMAVSSCATANDYRLHLLHLPCHQHLQGVEVEWLFAAVASVMRTPPGLGA